MNYKAGDKIRGLTLLQSPKNTKEHIDCIDEDGYKYSLTLDCIKDKRTKNFDKWDKTNPYKAYNMRLLASRKQYGCIILSSDDELFNSSNTKIRFKCPICGNPYEKKWCHWIGQPDNQHYCSKCSKEFSSVKRTHTYEQLKEIYLSYGLVLLSNYNDYLENGKSYAKLHCKNKEGYEYALNLYTIRNNYKNTGAFDETNPYSLKNLQKCCDEHNLQLIILRWIIDSAKRNKVEVLCSCKEHTFLTEPYKIVNKSQIKCTYCSKSISSYELLVKQWLESNNIHYEMEYSFEDCKNVRVLPFDFKCDVDNNIILIEVDGVQHYKEVGMFSSTLEEQKSRDKIKTEYCESNGYKLIRIPFWEFDEKETWENTLKHNFSHTV